MKSFRTLMAGVALVVLPVVSGCTTYYKVADPSTGKIYYTTEVKEKGGGTQLVDAKTGAEVRIQNSEITKVTQQEYETAKSQK